jgi:hypothetical protein
MSDLLTPAGAPAPAVVPARADARKVMAAQLGRRLLRILLPTRVRSLSVHDLAGELLWLNTGDFGERERRLLQDALDAFALDRALQHLERDLDNSRALLFCSRTSEGERETIVFAIVGGRRRPDIDPDALRERVLTTMRRFGSMAEKQTAPVAASAMSSSPVSSSPAVSGAAAPTAAPRLRTRLYARLRVGGTTRRYEVADSGTATLEHDLEMARRLVTLVKRRGMRDAPTPVSFTLPLCVESVVAAEFLERLAPTLEQAGIPADAMGFCVPCLAWQQNLPATELFIERCAELCCFVALDDFNLARAGFALMRGTALRCVKLDATLTALEDKFAHANVAAIAKAAQVLGLYCVAKQVKTPEEARWMASAGIEFADRITRDGKGAATTRSARALKIAGAS